MNPLASPASALILITLAITLGYAGLCWVKPFGQCRHCRPTDRRPRGRRHCHRCHNTRLRLRTGRRVWNLIHRLYTEGTR